MSTTGLGAMKVKSSRNWSAVVYPKDRSGSKVPPEKRKAKARAKRKARKAAR